MASVMYRRHVSENGLEVRIGEDEYSFLRTWFPHESTGKNFMLTKFHPLLGGQYQGARKVIEAWDPDPDEDAVDVAGWLPACGTVLLEDGPRKVWASVNGTASSYTVPVQWTLSLDAGCFDEDDVVIGSRTPTMSSNVPYLIGPSGDEYVIPSSTPDGDYHVCAGINPDQSIPEVEDSFHDNVVRSEAKWSIDCP